LFYIVVFYFHGIPACAILTFGQNVLLLSHVLPFNFSLVVALPDLVLLPVTTAVLP
jgi:hypothetical protein